MFTFNGFLAKLKTKFSTNKTPTNNHRFPLVLPDGTPDGKITSAVDESMLWTFTDASGSLTAYDEQPVYFIQDAAGKYLQRGSMSRGNSGLILADAPHATMRYNTWSAKAYDGLEARNSACMSTPRELTAATMQPASTAPRPASISRAR